MTINVKLSTESIEDAIRKLWAAKENLRTGMQQVVDVLAKDGAEVAEEAIGGMAEVSHESAPDSLFSATGRIIVSGKAAIVQEFGAGYAVMDYHPFADRAGVPVYVGSYSEENEGDFYRTDLESPGEGFWMFGGARYDRVQPRHGLLNAHDYIRENAGRIASEVIKL